MVMSASRTQQRMRDLENSLRHDIARQNDRQEDKFGHEILRLETNINYMQKTPTTGTPSTDMKAAEERIAKLELVEKMHRAAENKENDGRTVRVAQPRSSSWTPAHVVLRQWPENTERTQVVSEALAFINRLSNDARRWCAKPYAPKKYGALPRSRLKHMHCRPACGRASERERRAAQRDGVCDGGRTSNRVRRRDASSGPTRKQHRGRGMLWQARTSRSRAIAPDGGRSRISRRTAGKAANGSTRMDGTSSWATWA